MTSPRADSTGASTLRDVSALRAEFPGLDGTHAALDGAAGTQVPEAVITAIEGALRTAMSNAHGAFAASRRSDEVLTGARRAVADLVGGSPEGVILGPNMTTLTFHLADALSRTWVEGDEVVVTSLDHDANIRPWCWAAERAGATVRMVEFDPATGELPVEAVREVLSERTRLVAVTAASNMIGTRPDLPAISRAAHDLGSLTFVDGVHATAHGPVDVAALGADFYACSSYKFCGPHTGSVTAPPELLERLSPAKLLPAPDTVPDRFERGTPPFELLAGVTAAIDWLADLTDTGGDRRGRLLASTAAVEARLQVLLERLLSGLAAIPGVRVLGSAPRRATTVSFTIEGIEPALVARRLADRKISVWSGDSYACELIRRFGLSQAGGAVRVSIVLYTEEREIDLFLACLTALAAEAGDRQRSSNAGA